MPNMKKTKSQGRSEKPMDSLTKKAEQMKQLFESRRRRYFSTTERFNIYKLLRNRPLYNKLVDMMGSECRVRTLLWLKASGALC